MNARDDFERVRQACLIADGEIAGTCHEKAFNNLFTARPLKDLVAEGWKYLHVSKDNGITYEPMEVFDRKKIYGLKNESYSMLAMNGSENTIIFDSPSDEKISNYLAIPILTPEDMGEG